MTTKHSTMEWFAGDDWQINATLLDDNGEPFNLNSAEILWALISASSKRVLDQEDVNIALTDAVSGKCSIHIPAEKTSPLSGGTYTDYIRVISGGITSTLSTGPIQVQDNPWIAEEVAAAALKPQFRFKRIA